MNLRTTMAKPSRPAAPPASMTDRQRQARDLVQAYRSVALEPPSLGWLGRRLGVSRQRAREIRDALRHRGFWDDGGA